MPAKSIVNECRFPITVWPATPLGPTVVERWALLLSEGGELHQRSGLEPQELPEEWVLRQLLKADLDVDDQVTDLLENYGGISRPYFDPAYVPEGRRHLLAHSPSPDEHLRADWWENRGDGTIEDVRWWLKTARALAGIWRKTARDEPPAAAAWAAEGFVALDDERSSWAQFTFALNIGLRPFRAHAEHAVELPGGSEFTYGLPRVGLYTAACRQIFNLIVEDGTARLCENEPCPVVFVRQIGGAQAGQYRKTGLRFCSPACARAQTQRNYRRNQAKRRQPDGKS